MTKPMDFIDIDDKDKKILDILQHDAKTSLRDMAKETGLSTTAIRARLNKLKEEEVIKSQITLIDCSKLGYREMVLASLRVNSSQPLDQIKKKIDEMEKIKYAYIITGEYPLFLMFKCLDHGDSIKQIEALRNLPGVEEVKTQIVLDRIKEDHSIIIP
ncbi:MAG: Lrp/AsnC family transcriptional regulator [Candidatus Lokiarchaeota archaeon]|nr:Lrp/AsnC family transcriptional regulator [Candidatus Lokiarchaeota archaeon]